MGPTPPRLQAVVGVERFITETRTILDVSFSCLAVWLSTDGVQPIASNWKELVPLRGLLSNLLEAVQDPRILFQSDPGDTFLRVLDEVQE